MKFITRIFIVVIWLFYLSACASLQSTAPKQEVLDVASREAMLRQQDQWQIKGKIAFISPEKKQSANFYWTQKANYRELNLTTFLGVSVLKLKSEQGLHTLKVDGETYQHHDLTELLESASGLTLPVEAFEYWLKSIGYLPNDKFDINPETKLPIQLTTQVENRSWQVSYDKYIAIDGIMLAHKLKAQQGSLTIKIAINKWQLN